MKNLVTIIKLEINSRKKFLILFFSLICGIVIPTIPHLIDFIESELFNEIGIDSLNGATDVALRHYTYETGNDFIQDKVSH